MAFDSGAEVYPSSVRGAPTAYRIVTAADVVAAPTVGSTSAVTGGSLVNTSVYNIKVVAGNDLGRTPLSTGGAVTAAGANLTTRIPISGSLSAAYYDIYCSTDADPKWVARVTAAQLAAGALVTAVGVVGAGSIANAVDVQIPGTGNQLGTGAVENTAYLMGGIPIINTLNYVYCDFDITYTVTGDSGATALVLVPFVKNNSSAAFYQDSLMAANFGGIANNFGAYRSRVRVDVRASDKLVLAVAKLSGLGVSIDIQYTLCS